MNQNTLIHHIKAVAIILLILGTATIPGHSEDADSSAKLKQLLAQGEQLHSKGTALTLERQEIDKTEQALIRKDKDLKAEVRSIEVEKGKLDRDGADYNRAYTAHDATRSGVDRTNKAELDAWNRKMQSLNDTFDRLTARKAALDKHTRERLVASGKLSNDTLANAQAKKTNIAKQEDYAASLSQWQQDLTAFIDSGFLKDLKQREQLSRQAAALAATGRQGDLEAAVGILQKVWDGSKQNP